MLKPEIIDAHHHLWNLETGAYSWLTGAQHEMPLLGDYGEICKSYLIENYKNDIQHQNVVKSVHVQANWDRDKDPVRETAWLQSVADMHGYPHGIVAAGLPHDEDFEGTVERHSEHANLRGIRHMVNWHTHEGYRFTDRSDYITDNSWRKGLQILRRYDLSFDLGINYNQLLEAAKAMATIPDTPVILNHVGFPILRSSEARTNWQQDLSIFSKVPNTYVKLSGFVMFDHHWTTESIRPIILHAIDCFGPSRCMFTSNYPVDKLFSDYDGLFSAYREIVQDFSVDEQHHLFNSTAARVYRL